MSNDRGVFRLGAYRRAQVEGQGVDLNDVWFTSTTTGGYFAGGLGPGSPTYVGTPIPGSLGSTIVSKLTFGSGTLARIPSGDLPDENVASGPFSSNSAGYMVGGSNSGNGRNSTVRKLTYSTDTTASIGDLGGLSDGWLGAATFNSLTAGYATAGNAGPHSNQHPVGGTNYATKMTFGSDSWNTIPHLGLPVGRTGQALSSSTSGYVVGGRTDSGSVPTYGYLKSFVSKFSFSSDTNSRTPSSDLSIPIKNVSATGDSSSGYIMGGGTDDVNYTSVTSRIQKFSYTTETTSLNPSNIPVAMLSSSATGDKTNGYSAGGVDGSSNYYSSITKIDFSTGTTSSFGSDLPQGARSSIGAFSPIQGNIPEVPIRWTDGFKEDDLKAGYYSGGGSDNSSSLTQKVNYVTDQASLVPGGNLPDNGGMFAGANSNSIKTIMSGGEPGGNPFMQFVYTTETASNLTGSMPSRRTLNNDMGYGTESVGYVTGGQKEPSSPSAYYSSTQKIEFATDTASEAPGANSNWTMRYAGAFGNVDHTLGYVVGGQTFPASSSISRIQKMTYSTETMANTPANMQNGYFNLGTTSGPDAGYIYSKQEYPGWTANGAIEKFVYATDSRSTVPQPSYYPVFGANGTGNSTNGYYGGGYGSPTPHRFTRILKLSFSTGVGQDMPSSQFPSPKGVYRSAAGSAVSRKKSPKGAPVPTPTPTSPAQPVPNLSTNGYNVGGYWNSHPSYGNVSQSWIMKTSYSSDTTSLSPNKMIVGRNQFGTFSSATAGYILGGSYEGWPSQQPATTNIQKVTYSNDTASTSPGQLAAGAQRGSGVSNPITGYVAGGIPAMGSRIQKYTFSTETLSAYIPAQLGNNEGSPSGLYDMGSAGNTTHGYFMGGDVPGNPGYMRRGTKIAYATDTADASQMFGDLQGARNFAAVGYANIAAYLSGREGGNSGSGNRSLLAKLTYSTDSITTIPSTTFNNSNGNYAGHGNETKGFFAGAGEGTRQYKLTYSTESLSLSPSNSWNFPSSVPGSGGPGAYDFSQGGAFSARNNDGGKVPVPVVF